MADVEQDQDVAKQELEFAKSTGAIHEAFMQRIQTALTKISEGVEVEDHQHYLDTLHPNFMLLVKSYRPQPNDDSRTPLTDYANANGFNFILEAYRADHVQDLYNMISELPQIEHLTDDRVNRWLSAIMDFEPQRVKWHIKRLSGLGGSEIGTVVAPFMEVHDPFDQPKDIFMDKMMLTIPDPPNGHMKRGTVMEDSIADAFRRKFNAKVRTEDLDKYLTFRDPDHPWLVGNPDDFVTIGGKNYMVDYKCPMPGFKAKYDKYGVSFGYVAQLHHYTLIGKKLGLQVDGLLLCSWDMENWDVDVRPVEMNDTLFENILIAGDWMFTDCIMNNRMPRVDMPDRITVDGDSEEGRKLLDLMEQSAKLNTLSKRAYAQNEDTKTAIIDLIGKAKLGAGKISHALMDVSVKEVLDEQRAKDKLTALGYDIEDFMVPGNYKLDEVVALAQANGLNLEACRDKTLDHEIVYQVLNENNIDRVEVEVEDIGLKLSMSGHDQIKSNNKALRAEADLVVGAFVTKMKGKYLPEFGKGAPAKGPKP